MTYLVLLERRAEQDLNALPGAIRSSSLKKLSALRANPRPAGSKKLSGTAHNWRIRQGDYRILYTVSDQEKTVRVFRVRHRSQAYR